jgi:hypothetical protein
MSEPATLMQLHGDAMDAMRIAATSAGAYRGEVMARHDFIAYDAIRRSAFEKTRALEVAIRALHKDSARYRWLRDERNCGKFTLSMNSRALEGGGEELDACIDAAMTPSEPTRDLRAKE